MSANLASRAASPDPSTLAARLETTGYALIVAMPLAMWLANRSAPLILVLATLSFAAAALASEGAWPSLARAGRMARRPAVAFLALFLAWALLSVTWSHASRQSLGMWGELALPLLCALVIAASGRMRPSIGFSRALAISLITASVLMSYELLTDLAIRIALGLGKQHGFVFNRPMLVDLLLAGAVLPRLFMGETRDRLLGCAALPAVATAIFISDSGAAKLGLLIMLPVWLLATLWPRLVLAVVALGFAGAMALAPVQGQVSDALMPPSLHQKLAGAHTRERVDIWLSFGEVVRLRPLQGSGFNTSATFESHPLADRVPEPFRRMLAVGHPHSAPIQAWVETGGIGAVLLILAGLALLWSLRNGPTRQIAPALGLFAAGFGVASTAHGAWQGWWIAALATAALWLSFSDRWDQPADGVRNG